jgi:hypothetical protein
MRPSLHFLIASLAALVSGHGIVTSPPPRTIGKASLAACGSAITNIIKADNQSGVEVLHKASVNDKTYDAKKCVLQLCKGLQLDDNLHNVQNDTPGQEVNIKVWTRIPHKGWVNLAIIDTQTQFIIGEPLASFETDSMSGYEEGKVLADMDFNITIPKLYPRCTVAGQCVSLLITHFFAYLLGFWRVSTDSHHRSCSGRGSEEW